jgi:hypothetical protein
MVKRIWTPSWLLFSGGWCFLFLAALAGYWLILTRILTRIPNPLGRGWRGGNSASLEGIRNQEAKVCHVRGETGFGQVFFEEKDGLALSLGAVAALRF